VTRWRRALLPLSVPYEMFSRARAWTYEKGIAQARRLPGVVISVGNLTVGGTGKTPFVIWLTRSLLEDGKHVAILTRGYRGNFRGTFSRLDGISKSTGDENLSDETRVVALGLVQEANAATHLAFGVGPKRFEMGAQLAGDGFDWFVLDDGFQHLQLARDLNVLVIDASNPFGGGHLLPAGNLREPRSAIGRADVIIITRTAHAPAVEAVIRRYAQTVPIFYATMNCESFTPSHEDEAFERLSQQEQRKAEIFERKRVFAFSAIGNPSAFLDNLHEWGVPVIGQYSFPDHHKISAADAAKVEVQARAAGANALVCTEKDLMNLQKLDAFSLPVWICRASLNVHRADEFWRVSREILRLRKPEIVK